MSLETRLQSIIRNVTLGRANREETVAEITRIVDALCEGAKSRGYDLGYEAGKKEGYDEGRENGYEAGFDAGKGEGRNEGVNLAVSRIREYGYGIPYPQRVRAEEIARGVY